MTESGDTAPAAQPAADDPRIPPRPPPPVPASPAPPVAGQGYPMPPEYATLPYPAQYRPAESDPPAPTAQPYAYAPPAGYAPPPQGYGPYVPMAASAPPARRGPVLGIVAFVLAMLAAVGATIVGAIAGYSIGLGTGRSIALQPMDIDFDWSILTPVRDWVLLGEAAFWTGTVLGTWALVQGIVAIVKDRGRGWAIAAVILAVLGPIAFAVAVQALLTAGFASGASVG